MTTLLCTEAALEQYEATWRSLVPTLDFVTIPRTERVPLEDLARADIAVLTGDVWTDRGAGRLFSVVKKASNLRWFHVFAAGTNEPIFDELRARGVSITHSAGSSARPIAHTVMMHLIALCRNARTFAVDQSNKRWLELDGVDLEGRTLGIVGLGQIGAELALLAPHFGMRVIGLRRTVRGDEPCETWPISRLHDLLPMVDDLVLAASLNDTSQGIIGAAELAMLRPGAHLVNVGRGGLIDEQALTDSLRNGHLGGAALDVFVVEPLPATSELWDLPNVIVTPHSAASTPIGYVRAAEIFHDNLDRYSRGVELRNLAP